MSEEDKESESENESDDAQHAKSTIEEEDLEANCNPALQYNPSHPNRKRRTMRSLDCKERLLLVKMVTSKKRTSVEIADLMNVKVQVIYDLTKSLRSK